MSLAKLILPAQIRRNYDPDAAAYIAAVELADGQSLERGVKDAITEFVIGCKTRGIWDAIKSCCLLCGARTIAGATVPLKGNAPILTSFVGNYNRETGLRRTSGSFNVNRNNNTDPQNNKHVAVYPTSIDYGSSDTNFRSILTASTLSGGTFFAVNSLGLNVRVNTDTNIVANQPVSGGNLIGVSVLDGSRSQLLYNNNINIFNRNTTTPVASDLTLFGGGGVSTSLSRVLFYSIGERLDLRSLNELVTNFRRKLLISLSTYQAIDSDASSYIKRVELADGFVLESSVKQAIDNLVIGLKADGLWQSIKACCIMSGPKTLNGALTPLIGQSPQNFNFTGSNYIRDFGLIGIDNGVRYLDSKRPNNADPQNNHHMCVYRSVGFYNLNIFIGSVAFGAVNGDRIGSTGQFAGSFLTSSRSSNNIGTSSGFNLTAGLIGIARNNANTYEVIGSNLTTSLSQQSTTPTSTNITVFAAPGGGINSGSNIRLSFYSIGEYLNLSLLDARLDTFMAALSNAGI